MLRSIALGAFLAFPLIAPVAGQEAYQLGELQAKRVTVAQGAYFPRLVQARNGDLLAFFKTGAAHIGKSGRASMSRSVDGGETWSQPETVFDRPDADDAVIATGVLSDGTILAAAVSYTWTGERYSFEGWHASVWLIRSNDSGKTWSDPRLIPVTPFDWAYPFGHILELPDRSLLLTGYGGQLPMSRDHESVAIAIRSNDGGQTWSAPSVVARGYNEVSSVLRHDGSILAVIRSSAGGRLDSTISHDQGRTWTLPRRITENNEHPGDLLRLRSGDLLLSFGQRNKPYGVQAMLSRDDGATWDRGQRFLLAWDGDHSDLGYPVSVERPDGRLVTVYYIAYGKRDPEGIKGIAPKNAFTKAVIWSLNTPARPSLNWSEKRSLPHGVSGAAAASLDGEIVLAGGSTWEEGVKRTLAELQIYSPAADSWRFGPPMPNKLAYAPFLQSSDGLEVFGGTDGAAATRAIWKLGPGKTTWTRVGETPIDTILGQAALLGNRTLLFGGCSDVADLTRCSNDVWQRISNREWTKAGSLPVPRLAVAAAAVAGGAVYLFGGCAMPAPGDLRNHAEVHV